MKVFAVALLCLQIFCNAEQRNLEPCLNPNQRDGFCVDINQCTTFWNRGRVRTPSERRFLEESKCDPHNPRHVCCTMDTDFFSDLSVCGGDRVKPNIITGVPAVRGEYSWMVLLEFLEEAIRCSGNLINPKYVLTAAHCLDKSPVSVILGVHEIHDVNIVRMEIEEIKIHERFSYSSGENDIGLIRLTGSVTYTAYIRPACLPSSVGRKQLQPGDQLSVAGWGATEYTDDQGKRLNSRIKLKTRISYADWGWCRERYSTRHYLANSQMCAGGDKQADSCRGDSGGPLMSFNIEQNVWVLEGLVSFGHSCGEIGWPAVYTNVTYYENWIMRNLRA